ncbi:MAG: glycosyltransferase [Chloroflexota bacterium]
MTVTGWVESVQPYLAGTAVFLMPFRVGSGTRLKLIEAMAAGKAIVSTPIGAEGFPVQHGREILLGETAAELETAVLHLLDHAQERTRLGAAARQFAQQYDWRVVVPQFDEVYRRILGSG